MDDDNGNSYTKQNKTKLLLLHHRLRESEKNFCWYNFENGYIDNNSHGDSIYISPHTHIYDRIIESKKKRKLKKKT